MCIPEREDLARGRAERARAVAGAGGVEAAIRAGTLPPRLDTTMVEALVLGLLLQGVHRFVAVLGHGTTELGEVLRIYEEAGVVRTIGVRSEIEASHAAAALRWVTGEKAAVVTSIGPGALQALAASLVPASDGLGVWYILGDETTEEEGPNMQQVPRWEQGLFHRLFSAMGQTWCLHTPAALPTALRRGRATVDAPHGAGPCFLLLPMNTQPATMPAFNLDELPRGPIPAPGPATHGLHAAARAILEAERVVVKLGAGALGARQEVERLLELGDALAVAGPRTTGLIPHGHPRYMGVGGSKGSISGNFAMEEADLLVLLGSRGVCQSDCSRTGYPNVRTVVNLNTDLHAVTGYNKTIPLLGDIALTLADLCRLMEAEAPPQTDGSSPWLQACQEKALEWEEWKARRYSRPVLHDPVWEREVLTQPAVIKAASDWARSKDVVSFFDAGDVQANGFQIVEDDRPGRTFTEAGASYMGFAASALLAGALSTEPFYGLAFTGDGSFTMSPQILVDGVAHGARGCILLLDNRRMAAISGLQVAQHGKEYATWDHIPVDYVAWARAVEGVAAFHGGYGVASLVEALEGAWRHPGISLVHVPVYHGPDPMGSMGAFGRWNVGSWVAATQALRHDLGL